MSLLIADVLNDRIYVKLSEDEVFHIESASIINEHIFHEVKNKNHDVIEKINDVIRDELDFKISQDIDEVILINEDKYNLKQKSIMAFSNVKCIYAHRGRHWFDIFDENDTSFTEVLSRYLKTYDIHNLDGLYLIFENTNVTNDNDLGIKLANFLKTIQDNFASNLLKNITDEKWRFRIDGVELYLLVFSNHYPKNHSRYLPLNNTISFLIQPDQSFDRFADNDSNLITKDNKEKIRENYRKEGCIYNYLLSESSDHRAKFVKSTDTTNVINWWSN